MELNREQIKKALECCGEYNHGQPCKECPYMYDELADNEICSNRMAQDALSLIKELTVELEAMRGAANSYKMHNEELTEEDENWRIDAENYRNELAAVREESKKWEQAYDCMHSACRELSDTCDRLTEENERLKVQRYYVSHDGRLEMIPTVESVRADTVRKMLDIMTEHATNGYPRKVRLDVVDQIAKEMLEGKK